MSVRSPRVTSAAPAGIARCRLGRQDFALDLDRAEGIEGIERLQLSPADRGAFGWLLGEREDVPVWSLARLLGRRLDAAPEAALVLVFPAGPLGGRFGVLVDGVEPLGAPPEAVHPLPSPFLRCGSRGLGGVVVAAGEPLLLLDPEALRPERTDAPGSPEPAPPGGGGPAAPGPPRLLHDVSRRSGQVLVADLLARTAGGRHAALALPAAQVIEVVGARPIAPVPGAPDRLPGLILWRDRALAVLDPARCAAGPDRLAADEPPAARFVVADTGAELVALPVGRGLRFQPLPLPARPLPRSGSEAPEVLGRYDLGDSELVVLDLARALALAGGSA